MNLASFIETMNYMKIASLLIILLNKKFNKTWT